MVSAPAIPIVTECSPGTPVVLFEELMIAPGSESPNEPYSFDEVELTMGGW